MEKEVIAFLVVFGLAIVLKLIKYKLNFRQLKSNFWKIVKDLFFVLTEYTLFLVGIAITMCFINNGNTCGGGELKYIIIGVGILVSLSSLIGYFNTILKDFYKKKKKEG